MFIELHPTTPAGGGGISTTVLIVLGSILVAAIAAIGTWLGVRRVNSGGIKTSTAEDLWNAGNQLRKDVTDRLVATETKLDIALRDAAEARAQSAMWQQRYEDQEAEMSKMRRQIRNLQRQMNELKKR